MLSQFDIRRYDKKLQEKREEREKEEDEIVQYRKKLKRKRMFVTPELVKEIKRLTRETDWTQDKIAKILGCSQTTISRYYDIKKEHS